VNSNFLGWCNWGKKRGMSTINILKKKKPRYTNFIPIEMEALEKKGEPNIEIF